PRAAVCDGVVTGPRARRLEASAKLLGTEEAALRSERAEGQVHGSRDAARDGVDRLDLTAIALGRTSVEEDAPGLGRRQLVSRRGLVCGRLRLEVARLDLLRSRVEPAALLAPAAQAAVEDGYLL